MSAFEVEVFQNEYLPSGGTKVNAIVTISSSIGRNGREGPRAARRRRDRDRRHLGIDGGARGRRARPRRDATAVAIDCIRDGSCRRDRRERHSPPADLPAYGGSSSPHPKRSRGEAKQAAGAAQGGRRDGDRHMAARRRRRVRGSARTGVPRDPADRRRQRARDPGAARGRHWRLRGPVSVRLPGASAPIGRSSELRRVASVLLGSVDIIADPADMAADFRSMTEAAMGKTTGASSLRIWTPQGATGTVVRQVAPTIEELTDRAAAANPLTADYPTGSWGEESRDYHVCIEVPPHQSGDEMLAGRVGLVHGEEVLSQGLIKAIWTSDQQLSTQISREVAHYTGQAELAECIQEGLEARKSGDNATATFKLGRAVQLAAESGNDGTMKLLAGGRRRRGPGNRHGAPSAARSRRSTRWRSTRARPGPCAWAGGMTATCPSGHASATADYCDQCGAPIAAVASPQQATVELPVLEETETSPSEVPRAVPGVRRAALGRRPLLRGMRPRLSRPATPGDGAGRRWSAPTESQFERLRGRRDRVPGDYVERRFALDAPTDADRAAGAAGPASPRPRSTWRALPRIRAISRLHAVLERRSDGGVCDPRPRIDERHDGQRRPALRSGHATRPCRWPTATGSRSAPGRRSRSAAVERAQKSWAASSPELSTIVASRRRFSFCGSSSRAKRANRARRCP